MTVPVAPPSDDVQALVDRAMDRVAGGRAIPGNKVAILFDGPEVFPAMLERIKAARRWIHFDNYIFRDDATGRLFADALCEQASAGIKVRVMADWYGSWGTSRKFWRRLRSSGAEVRLFGPPNFLRPFDNLTRDHRKLVVVDGCTSVTGGLCIGDEWAGNPARNRRPWRDTGVAIDGPAAGALDRAFAAVWQSIGPSLPEEELAADIPSGGDAAVRVVAGEPGGIRAARMTELLLAGAAQRVWLTDAYLVAPRGLYRSLLDAAQEGVDVRLLVPGTSDLPQIRNLTRSGYRELLSCGVRIFEWRGPMLHAKTIVADGRWVRIGSTNMNVSSLVANYELDVLIDDREFATQMEAQFRRDLDQSVEVWLRPAHRFGDRLDFRTHATDASHDAVVRMRARGLREHRHRTVVALRALAGGSEHAILLQRSLALAVLALLLILVPHVVGGVIAVLVLYFAATGTLEMLQRQKSDGEADQSPD